MKKNHDVIFATEEGKKAAKCDPKLRNGVICGKLGAYNEALAFYDEMVEDDNFKNPISWASIKPETYDGLWLTGGHAPKMKQYLGSSVLQQKVAEFWELAENEFDRKDEKNSRKRVVGAICHGVLVLARANYRSKKRSLLYEKKTMCLPKYMERAAFYVTFCCLGKYYRTYPEYVEDEVKSVLKNQSQYDGGNKGTCGYIPPPRGSAKDDTHAAALVDGHYVSGRWPGDAYLVAKNFLRIAENKE